MFNYQNLESGQFEELCCDIMQVKTGKQLHVFAKGPDEGVDLTDDSYQYNIVVQIKHYSKSSFSALKSKLEKEVEKVKRLNPKQYYICVSQSLSNANVRTIYLMFSSYMESASNIIMLDDIDYFLHEQDNLEITRKHTKLWLESGVTLQLLLECFPVMKLYPDYGSVLLSTGTTYPKCLTTFVPTEPEIGLIGRDHVIEQVFEMLDSDRCIALVSGLGGIGKTAVMAQICNSIMTKSEKDTYVAWITCGESIEADFLSLKEPLGIPNALSGKKAFEEVIKKIHNLQGTLYLFMDNMYRKCSNVELGIINALRPKVHIMITSRIEYDAFPLIRMSALEPETAVKLFYAYYKRDTDNKYKDFAMSIVGSVKQHTLLVELLAKAARKSGGTLQSFYERLKEKGLFDVFDRKIKTSIYDEELTIQQYVIRLYERFDLLSKEQKHILRLFSIFTPEREIYYKIADWAELNKDALDELVELSWIDQGGLENGYRIHHIIKDSLAQQIKLSGDVLKLNDYGDFLKHVANTDYYLSEDTDYALLKERIVLTENIAEYMEKCVDREKAGNHCSVDLFKNLAKVYAVQGAYEDLLSQIVYEPELLEALSGIERPLTATIYEYDPYNNYTKALYYYNKAIDMYENLYETDNLYLVEIYSNMGSVAHCTRNIEIAHDFFEKALIIGKQNLETSYTDSTEKKTNVELRTEIARIYDGIAKLSWDIGDTKKELGFYGKALEIRKQVLGNNHWKTASSYGNIAGVYYSNDDCDRALEYLEKAIEILERIQDSKTLILVGLCWEISYIYFDIKENKKKALFYLEKASCSLEQVTGIERLELSLISEKIANMWTWLDEHDKALEYYRITLSIYEQFLIKDNLSTARIYIGIGQVYLLKSEYENALFYYRRALDIRERELGHMNPRTAGIYSNMGHVFEKKKDYSKSLELYNEALKIRTHTRGESNPITIETYEDIIDVYVKLGEYQKVLDEYKIIFDILKKITVIGQWNMARRLFNS